MIIFPAIDIRGGKCVRLRQGDYQQETVYGDDPAAQARAWAEAGAEFLHLVDLDGAKEGRPANLQSLRKIAAAIKIPCELGGGIRTEADAKEVLAAGASRVILGTVACEKAELVKSLLKSCGPEKLVLGIDAKNGKVAVRGWLQDSGLEVLSLAQKFAEMGVIRIIYTDIATDGMLSGPNLKAVSALCEHVPSCKIIASGGVSCADDIRALCSLGKKNLEGAIVGKALYDGRVSMAELLDAAKLMKT